MPDNPLTLEQIIEGLEQRGKMLLEQLQGFKDIETEYRKVQKSLTALRDQPIVLESGAKIAGPGTQAHRCLGIIAGALEGIRPHDIAHKLATAPANIGGACKDLLRAGYATRSRHGREVFYRITPRGEQLLGGEAFAETQAESPFDVRRSSHGHDGKLGQLKVLEAIASGPMRSNDVLEYLNLKGGTYKSRLSVTLPLLKRKGYATGKDGLYTITKAGRTRLAEEMQGGEA